MFGGPADLEDDELDDIADEIESRA